MQGKMFFCVCVDILKNRPDVVVQLRLEVSSPGVAVFDTRPQPLQQQHQLGQ